MSSVCTKGASLIFARSCSYADYPFRLFQRILRYRTLRNLNPGQSFQNRRKLSERHSGAEMQRIRRRLYSRPQTMRRRTVLASGKIRVPPPHPASALPAAAHFHFVALHYRTWHLLYIGDRRQFRSVWFQRAATVRTARFRRHRDRLPDCFRWFFPPQERTFARLAARRFRIGFVRAPGKWRRPSSPPAPQILVLPPQLFYLSPQFDNDLNQFSATDCLQVCQTTECMIFVPRARPFKSGDESRR